jgi:F-type H+-transporting ATPase subunit delta
MVSSDNYKVAKNYAQALFEISIQLKQNDDVYKSFLKIKNVLKEESWLKKLIKNPLLTKNDQKQIISLLVSKKMEPFFAFIINKKRLNILEEIAHAFVDKMDSFTSVTNVGIETAYPLTTKQRENLVEKLKVLIGPHTFHIEETLNPRLFGGFRLKLKDKMLDLSLATHAQNILQGYHA